MVFQHPARETSANALSSGDSGVDSWKPALLATGEALAFDSEGQLNDRSFFFSFKKVLQFSHHLEIFSIIFISE